MSQTLQNQILLAKSMNGIVEFNDGAGTIISGGTIVTPSINGNIATSDLTYSNTASPSSITLTNPSFQLPYYGGTSTNYYVGTSSTVSSTTYPPNDPYLTAFGFTGWGFSGTNYRAGIQSGTGGAYYTTYFPTGTQAVFIRSGGTVTMTSQNYTLQRGQYIFTYYLQQNETVPTTKLLVASVVTGSTTVRSSQSLYVGATYPNWGEFKLFFNAETAGSYFFKFNLSGAGDGYILVSSTSLAFNSGVFLKDGTTTSTVGAKESILNTVAVNNGLNILSGGIDVVGPAKFGTPYGINNLAINSTMASTSGASTTSSLMALGLGAFQNVTTGSRSIGIGNGAGQYAVNISNLVVVGASCIDASNSTLIGVDVAVTNRRNNALVGYSIGPTVGVGNFNSCFGSGIFQAYGGYGDVIPSYNCAVGYRSQANSGDNFNTSIGTHSLENMNGKNRIGGTPVTYTPSTQFNTAIGHYAGQVANLINNCTFLGAFTDVTTNGLTGVTCVGYNTKCGTSSTIQLGSNNEVVAFTGSLKSGTNTITATQLGYLSAVTGGIVDTSANQTIGGTKTFSVAPVMSGASITAASIADSALSSNVALLTGTQTFTGAKTFSSLTVTNPLNITPVSSTVQILNGSGANVLRYNSGWESTAIGLNALAAEGTSDQTPNSNMAIGAGALKVATSTKYCTAIGNNALTAYNVAGGSNFMTAIGYNALGGSTSGIQNTAIGAQSALNVTTSNYCTFIGYNTGQSTTETYNSSTAIGYGARVTGSNQVVIGTTDETHIIPSAKVQYGGKYQPNTVFNSITSTTDWNTSPPTIFSRYITFSSPDTIVFLTLPLISSANVFEGMEFIFRRTNTTVGAIVTSVLRAVASGTDDIYQPGSMSTLPTATVLDGGDYYGKIVCISKTGGTWAYFPS